MVKAILVLYIICTGVSLRHSTEGSTTNNLANYQNKFLLNLENGLKCRYGFKQISPKIVSAVESCAKNHHEISTSSCFTLCTYRAMEYIVQGSDTELDQAMGDVVIMEMIDMTTKKGRDTYFALVMRRFTCANDYQANHTKFPYKFDDAGKCSDLEGFFNCSFPSTCPT